MCGISGFWGPEDRPLLKRMAGVQRHRGPDDEGYLHTPEASLGFRRLSILDAAHGQQPMSSDDGNVSIAYNGEVYTYRELRTELAELGHTFHTDCDTEVVLQAYLAWGEECFTRFNGMWAAAILDRRAAPKLVLARDHFGIKPLHYATSSSGRVLFANEIKALLQDPDLDAVPDDQRLFEYLTAGLHDHTAGTFFTGIAQVPAAHLAVIDASGIALRPYWEPKLSSDGDPSRFRELFWKSVERRLVADVPVGTCLSGGLDSSAIVVAMTDLLRRNAPDATSLGDTLKTYSAVFDGDPIDESDYIKDVIDQTGAANVEIRPTSAGFFAELADFVFHLEEPIVSTGPYAQWCVQRRAREDVTVLLDGQGGDELLAGYVPYQLVYLKQLRREGRWAELARESAKARDVLAPLARRRLLQQRSALPVRSLLRPEWAGARGPVVDHRVSDDLKKRLLADLTTYSLPSLLRYEDRNSMAHSLESRPPFLDQELVEWVFTLPDTAIVHEGWSRAVLRDGLRGDLPERVRLRRKKIGFTTPESRWLKARRAQMRGLFRSPLFQSRPYWDGAAVAEAWEKSCAGEYSDSFFFWRALVVEMWLRLYVDGGLQAPVRQGYSAADVALNRDPARAPNGMLERSADAWAMASIPAEALAGLVANPGRPLLARIGGVTWARGAVRSPLVAGGDDLQAITLGVFDGIALRAGDVVAISEKVVAISQGRSFPVGEITPTPLATSLSKFVGRTPSGIGLGIPATMQLAIEEVGAPRIVAAAAAAAVTKPLGMKGVFYRVAGSAVSAIDGPTRGTIPPYDGHAKRPPAEPDAVAGRLAAALTSHAGVPVSVAVVDVNDIGGAVLGASAGVDRVTVIDVLRDNPLGQAAESTPFAVLRVVA